MLVPILSLLMGSGIQRTVARTKRNGIFIAVAVLFLLTAYVLGITAATIWLARIYGGAAAAVFLAVAAVVIALIALGAMAALNARDARLARERRANMQNLAALGISFIRGQPLLTAGVLAALVAANLVGQRDDD